MKRCSLFSLCGEERRCKYNGPRDVLRKPTNLIVYIQLQAAGALALGTCPKSITNSDVTSTAFFERSPPLASASRPVLVMPCWNFETISAPHFCKRETLDCLNGIQMESMKYIYIYIYTYIQYTCIIMYHVICIHNFHRSVNLHLEPTGAPFSRERFFFR